MFKQILKNTSRAFTLKNEIIPLWENLNMGVCIIDDKGFCVYMNSFQKHLDGFNQAEVIGKHMSELYLTHDVDELPSLECLHEEKAMLKKVYWYKTINNKLFNSINDFFPLFKKGKIDGVISFTQVYDLSHSYKPLQSSISLPESNSQFKKKESSKALELSKYYFTDIVGENEVMKTILNQSNLASQTATPVLIWGESGTGKELFAQAIHNSSKRKNAPVIPINCAAIPENLLEGILFGTSKGSYTDAIDKAGLFEEANGGTIIFDELNSMPIGLQAKLLRVLQEKTVRRIGAKNELSIDVRIISILNEPPYEAIAQGKLRKDLFYRLSVVSIKVPPLRERKDDIPLLVEKFKNEAIMKYNLSQIIISNEVMQAFYKNDWQGNVRELSHIIEGALVLLGEKKKLEIADLPSFFFENQKIHNIDFIAPDDKTQDDYTTKTSEKKENLSSYFDYADVNSKSRVSLKTCIEKYEASCLMNVLRKTGGNVAKAARILELTPSSLHYKMKVLSIDAEDF